MDLIIVISGLLIVISLNILFNHLIIRIALKKLIIPRLVDSGCSFVRIEKIGFLKTGNFKDSSLKISPYNPIGKYKISLYRYIFYKDKSEKERKTAVKIDWNLFKKTNIDFKPII